MKTHLKFSKSELVFDVKKLTEMHETTCFHIKLLNVDPDQSGLQVGIKQQAMKTLLCGTCHKCHIDINIMLSRLISREKS